MKDLFTVAVIFVITLMMIEGMFYLVRRTRNPEARRIKKQLKELSLEQYGKEDIDLVRRRILSDIPWLNRWLLRVNWPAFSNLDRLLLQANVKRPLGFFILTACLLACVGGLITYKLGVGIILSLLVAVLCGLVPLFYVHWKKEKRIKKFEEQLPDAMDMIARALKAGHAFTGGLQMVAKEFDDPIGTEFGKALDEINFGVSYENALKNLGMKIDCNDLKFFVISVIIQRQSGGNLAEILENIGRLIRERFKLKGHIRTLSAEARISAYILIALPFIMAAMLMYMNPEYLMPLIRDPIGNVMLGVAGALMAAGIVSMRRLVQITV
jgi:tight adherence protein B